MLLLIAAINKTKESIMKSILLVISVFLFFSVNLEASPRIDKTVEYECNNKDLVVESWKEHFENDHPFTSYALFYKSKLIEKDLWGDIIPIKNNSNDDHSNDNHYIFHSIDGKTHVQINENGSGHAYLKPYNEFYRHIIPINCEKN